MVAALLALSGYEESLPLPTLRVNQMCGIGIWMLWLCRPWLTDWLSRTCWWGLGRPSNLQPLVTLCRMVAGVSVGLWARSPQFHVVGQRHNFLNCGQDPMWGGIITCKVFCQQLNVSEPVITKSEFKIKFVITLRCFWWHLPMLSRGFTGALVLNTQVPCVMNTGIHQLSLRLLLVMNYIVVYCAQKGFYSWAGEMIQ